MGKKGNNRIIRDLPLKPGLKGKEYMKVYRSPDPISFAFDCDIVDLSKLRKIVGIARKKGISL